MILAPRPSHWAMSWGNVQLVLPLHIMCEQGDIMCEQWDQHGHHHHMHHLHAAHLLVFGSSVPVSSIVGARIVAPGFRSDWRVKHVTHHPARHDSLNATRAHRTCSIGVYLSPRFLDGFNRRFFSLCDVDGAGRSLVEEVFGVLPKGAVLDSDNLRRKAQQSEARG